MNGIILGIFCITVMSTGEGNLNTWSHNAQKLTDMDQKPQTLILNLNWRYTNYNNSHLNDNWHTHFLSGSETGRPALGGASGELQQPSLSYVQSTSDASMEGVTPTSPTAHISKEEATERLKVHVISHSQQTLSSQQQPNVSTAVLEKLLSW